MKSAQRLWTELNAVRRAVRIAEEYGFPTAEYLRQQEKKLKEQITEQTKRDKEKKQIAGDICRSHFITVKGLRRKAGAPGGHHGRTTESI